MIAALREWLIRMVAVSILLTVVQLLITDKALKRVSSLIGGFLLLLLLAEPLTRMNLKDIHLDLSDYERRIERAESNLKKTQSDRLAELIEEKTASYISDKARELGQSVTVRVRTAADENGVPIPSIVELEGERTPELAAWMGAELGLGEERQVWNGGKG